MRPFCNKDNAIESHRTLSETDTRILNCFFFSFLKVWRKYSTTSVQKAKPQKEIGKKNNKKWRTIYGAKEGSVLTHFLHNALRLRAPLSIIPTLFTSLSLSFFLSFHICVLYRCSRPFLPLFCLFLVPCVCIEIKSLRVLVPYVKVWHHGE